MFSRKDWLGAMTSPAIRKLRNPGRSALREYSPAVKAGKLNFPASPAPGAGYCKVGSSRSRSQSPITETASVVTTMVVAGASMIQGARVRYSRP